MIFRKQFGPFSSSSATKVSDSGHNDNRIAATDDAVVTKYSVGKKGSLKVNTTTTTTYVDPGAFDLVGQLLDVQGGVTAGALSFAAAAQEKNAKLAETKITDGANLNQKTALVALAVMAALGAFLLILKK
jgi:Pyruvate/2-oxoacid:ferredoxin oxidoreductase gamma subunit